MSLARKFKGWTVPGPAPQRPSPAHLLGDGDFPEPVTLDSISGHYQVFQFKNGHRFSTDDLLVAWWGTANAPSAGKILDLGSGIGSVATIVAFRCPGATLVTLEAQERSVILARESVKWNDLESRLTMLQGDFRDETPLHVISEKGPYDLVLGSPPYFPLDAGILATHPQKVECRFEARGDVSDYCQAAAKVLAPGGVLAIVFPVDPPHQLQRVVEAAKKSNLGIIRYRPVALKEGEAPLLGLFLLVKKTDWEFYDWSAQPVVHQDPPLIIRCQDGSIHSEYQVIKHSIGFHP